MKLFNWLFPDANEQVIDKMRPTVEQINALEPELVPLSDAELRARADALRDRAAAGDESENHLAEAFALTREANRRAIGIRHYDVQLMGGLVLQRGEIAEMKTGEGKTHVAALALFLNSLSGRGCHLITVNDYLARRDAGWNGPANHLLGARTACIINQASFIYDPEYTDESQIDERLRHLRPCERKEAYVAEITYGTASEFGFDYLRDNMASTLAQTVQRGHEFAIVDEVDSVLIDEARTPLIISAPAAESTKMYEQFANLVPRLKENEDYNIDEKMRAATLTEEGIEKVEKMLGLGNIYTEGGIDLVHHLEQALRAQALYHRDRDYVVQDDQVIIIDEFTGRLMQGRRYSEGLHQAIEAKERVKIQKESRTMATISLQNYFRMYKKLSGMTGTAVTEAEEFSKIYNLDVTVVPTNKPVRRMDLPDRIFATEKGKFQAVVREIKRLHESGQPVLVGTISVEKNEMLSLQLKQAGVPHQILNAKNHEREAQIIAQAGKPGAVTIATNMAGRGVDIVLGGSPQEPAVAEKIRALGGLFVLGTERHESRRIDNQLRGRAGRQGDPGATQFYLSLEDDLMRIFGSDRVKAVLQRLGMPEDEPIENKFISRSIEKAQTRVEGYYFDIRKHLVEYDDVLNKQREIIYRQRDEILHSTEKNPAVVADKIKDMIEEELEQLVLFHTAGEDEHAWNLREIAETVKTIFPLTDAEAAGIAEFKHLAGRPDEDARARTALIEMLTKIARGRYAEMEAKFHAVPGGADVLRTVEREILLRSQDQLWIEHLDAVNLLRTGIGLRGYGQRDPLLEYKKETYQMFLQLQNLIQKQVVYSIFKVGLNINTVPAAQQDEAKPTVAAGKAKAGPNDPCPCGAKKPDGTPMKYKHCCGS